MLTPFLGISLSYSQRVCIFFNVCFFFVCSLVFLSFCCFINLSYTYPYILSIILSVAFLSILCWDAYYTRFVASEFVFMFTFFVYSFKTLHTHYTMDNGIWLNVLFLCYVCIEWSILAINFSILLPAILKFFKQSTSDDLV